MILWISSFFSLLIALAFFLMAQKRMKVLQKQMEQTFKAISFDIIEQNGKNFLDLAKVSFERYAEGSKSDLESRQKAIEASLIPLKEIMHQLELRHRELENKREGAYASLVKQIDTLVQSERQLSKETTLLSQALRSPQVRGSWGQIHLRRVVELAGLLNHCDFFEQCSVTKEAKLLRPDLVISLPGARKIVVDAKAPLNAYLDAAETSNDELKEKKMQAHAISLRKHIKDLSNKEYWGQFELTPEYVILFLPAEAFFSAALQYDPSLIEIGADQNVIIATPTTLIAILRAVAFSWKQESLSKSAKQIAEIGEELYQRVGIVCDHWGRVGRNLNTAVQSYNQSIGSLEARVLPSIRKLKEVGGLSKEIPPLEPLDLLAREPHQQNIESSSPTIS